jgi:hypothetical protein
MFRKASYFAMVMSVLLSWGVIVHMAQKADQANGTDITPALLATLNPSATALANTSHSNLIPEKPVKIAVAVTKTKVTLQHKTKTTKSVKPVIKGAGNVNK